MENHNQDPQDPQQDPKRTRAQRMNRMFNRMILMLGFGIVALGVYQYVLVPMMN